MADHRPPVSAALLRATDFGALDPASAYGLQSSLLFQIEHVRLGPLTYEQGGRRQVGVPPPVPGAARGQARKNGAGKEDLRADPSWARTADGREWEEDFLRRLGACLLRPNAPSPDLDLDLGAKADAVDAALRPQVWVSDLPRLRLVVLMGWILSREEKEHEQIYTIDDGTGIVSVSCPRPPPSAAGGPSTSLGFSSSERKPFLSTTVAPPRDLQRYAAQLHAAQKFGALEARAERTESDRAVLPVGRVVRVVGRVEEPVYTWQTERTVVASRVELVDDLNCFSQYMLRVARAHEEVYARAFDVRARVEAIERGERDRKAREWEEGSSVASSAPSSPVKFTRERIRPPAPAKLPAEMITMSRFMLYIKMHLERRYLKRISGAVRPPASPSPSARGISSMPDAAAAAEEEEVSLPFKLPQLRANDNLHLFATRVAQETAREKERKRLARANRSRVQGSLAVMAEAVAGAKGGTAALRSRAWVRGGNPYLRGSDPPTMAPSSGRMRETAAERRERKRREGLAAFEEAGPLFDEELKVEVGKVWRTAIRSMRAEGTIVEAEEAEAEVEVAGNDGRKSDAPVSQRAALWARTSRQAAADEDDLPDLPRYARAEPAPASSPPAQVRTPTKRKVSAPVDKSLHACPWGDVRLGSSSDEEELKVDRSSAGPTPRAGMRQGDWSSPQQGSALACPWGEVKLESQDDEVRCPLSADVKTPLAARTNSRVSPFITPKQPYSPSDFELPPSAQAPSSPFRRPPGRSPSSASDASFLTTGSLADADDDEHPQRFQLVTASSLGPLVLTIVQNVYATNIHASSVSAEDVRARMYRDARWEAVARCGVQVDEALDLLCLDGSVHRHGEGYRPAERWANQ
ncbi:hypothetical protein JCM8202v2_002711 [Rhodotorula sphaerocarpa]